MAAEDVASRPWLDPMANSWIETFFMNGLPQTLNGTTANGGAIQPFTSGDAPITRLLAYNTIGSRASVGGGVWYIQGQTVENISGMTQTPSNSGNYLFQDGVMSYTGTGEPAHGVYFECRPSEHGAFVACVTSFNSVRTKTVTIVPPLSLKLSRIVFTNTKADFYINNVLVATHTTNIPGGVSLFTGIKLEIFDTGFNELHFGYRFFNIKRNNRWGS